MEFQEGRGMFELALLLAATLGLDFAELIHGLLELAGEPRVVQAEGDEGTVGVDDVKVGAVEESGFECGDAVDSPGGVGDFLDELSLGGSGGLVFVEELAAVALVGGGVLGGEDGGAAGETVGEGVLRRPLFAGGGAGSSGAIGGWGLGSRDWVCHMEASISVVAWAGGDLARWVVDVVGWERKIDQGVA
jgi:hypothetical protein